MDVPIVDYVPASKLLFWLVENLMSRTRSILGFTSLVNEFFYLSFAYRNTVLFNTRISFFVTKCVLSVFLPLIYTFEGCRQYGLMAKFTNLEKPIPRSSLILMFSKTIAKFHRNLLMGNYEVVIPIEILLIWFFLGFWVFFYCLLIVLSCHIVLLMIKL